MRQNFEVRSAEPIETRNEDDGDELVAATQAVEELRASVEQHRTATDERLTTEFRTITDRVAGIETRLNRPGAGRTENQGESRELDRRALDHYFRHYGT